MVRREREDHDGTRGATRDEEGADTGDGDGGGDGDGKVAHTRFCVGRCALSQGELLSFGGGGSSKEAGQRNEYARREAHGRDPPCLPTALNPERLRTPSATLLRRRTLCCLRGAVARETEKTAARSRNRELLVGPLSFPTPVRPARVWRVAGETRGIGPIETPRRSRIST